MTPSYTDLIFEIVSKPLGRHRYFVSEIHKIVFSDKIRPKANTAILLEIVKQKEKKQKEARTQQKRNVILFQAPSKSTLLTEESPSPINRPTGDFENPLQKEEEADDAAGGVPAAYAPAIFPKEQRKALRLEKKEQKRKEKEEKKQEKLRKTQDKKHGLHSQMDSAFRKAERKARFKSLKNIFLFKDAEDEAQKRDSMLNELVNQDGFYSEIRPVDDGVTYRKKKKSSDLPLILCIAGLALVAIYLVLLIGGMILV